MLLPTLTAAAIFKFAFASSGSSSFDSDQKDLTIDNTIYTHGARGGGADCSELDTILAGRALSNIRRDKSVTNVKDDHST